VIDKYCNDEQRKQPKKAMADWKRKWSKEDQAGPEAATSISPPPQEPRDPYGV